MESTQVNELPLSGIRVLDFTRALSGPLCTALLGDFGADVVKVEGISGELCRQWGPYQGEESLYFLSANRNKRSLTLDMWSDEGKKLLRDVVGTFDVVVENFRPGVLDSLGIGKEWLAENHPHVLVTSISGFGHVGPERDTPCFDQVALGAGGLMSITGTEETGPLRVGIPLADTLAGLFAAMGVCAALAGRGKVQTVQTSLLESVLGVLSFQGQQVLSGGEAPKPAGNDHPTIVPYGVFTAKDQRINLAAASQGQWESMWKVLGAPELAHDERWATPRNRFANKTLVVAEIEARLAEDIADVWLEKFKAAAVPAGPIYDLAQVFESAQVQALGTVQDVEHPTLGSVSMAQGPIWFDGEHTPIRRPAPQLGQHSVEVLAESGVSPERVAELLAGGVVSTTA